ncbi:MAG TPA: S-layer homology domain-containing protein [Trichocoleus sp.]
MLKPSLGQSGRSALALFGTFAGAATLLTNAAPASAQQARFSDVGFSYWARPVIERLAAENIIAGFPDGTFKPDQPVTRAQFAAIVEQAFDKPATRSAGSFPDVPSNYWAQNVIREAYRSGFLSGYPDGTFKPNQEIPRVQVLVSLSNGLGLTASGSVSESLDRYQDEDQIPGYAEDEVAAATQNGVVVNYPSVDLLRPGQVATRADVAAFIYQALVDQGKLPALTADSGVTRYIVASSSTSTPNQNTGNQNNNPTNQNADLRVESGTVIDVRYPNANTTGASGINIVVAPGQTVATTLDVAQPIRNAKGQVLIPAGSTIQGRIVPVTIQGSSITAAQFVADRLTVGNNAYDIRAASNPIAATQTVNQQTLQGALVTTAAQSILGPLLGGNQNLGSVIGQVITGSGNSNTQNAVIVIDPNQLDVRVDSAFYLNSTSQG